jgi:CRISPR-associated protein Cmr5
MSAQQSPQQSLEQKRAAAAWAFVENVKKNGKNKKGESFAKDYGSLAKDAPAHIQSNGLGQTLAFWYAKGFEKGEPKKGNNEHAQLFGDVSRWVGKQIKGNENLNLLDWIIKDANTNDYRRATAEAMAFLQWLKRFAEAELEDKPKSNEEAA